MEILGNYDKKKSVFTPKQLNLVFKKKIWLRGVGVDGWGPELNGKIRHFFLILP